jgi:hypothetical protein
VSGINPYAVRAITITLALGSGSFAGGGNTITLPGLRVEASIHYATLPAPDVGLFRIYGMTLDHINTFSYAGTFFLANPKNVIQVQAGDQGGQMTTVYTGIIRDAYPDFSVPGSPSFFIRANAAVGLQLTPVPAVSFSGSVSGATALTSIVQAGGLTLENNGINTQLVNPYFPGTAWAQIRRCVRALDCAAYHDPLANKLAIWPKNGSRTSNANTMPTISASEGMISYPMFEQSSIKLRTLFNPSLQQGAVGNQIQVQSQLTAANGKWNIYEIDYTLTSQEPDGPWEMLIFAFPNSLANPAGASPAGNVVVENMGT